jgi:tetratricopeptide (TPR) repeat protein
VPRSRAKAGAPAARRAERAPTPAPAKRARVGREPAVPWTWMALVAGVALAVYANSLGGGLVYDDANAIRNNPFVRNGDVEGIFTEPSWWGGARGPLWRPLTTLTFALDYALHGLEPFGYHLVNVVLHAAVSVLVLVVFAAVTATPATALAAALLFAAHPVHTEAVANVVGRAELIAAGGFFLAWWCWIRADRAAAAGRWTGYWVTATVVAYFLAMQGKENAITLPLALLVADLVYRRTDGPAGGLVQRATGHLSLATVGIAFVLLRAGVLGGVTPSPDLLDNPLATLGLGARLMTAVAVIGLYALRLVFPLWLSADYSYDQIPAVTSPLDVAFLGGVAVLCGAPALAWWAWRRVPALTLGMGVLGATFVVVANLFFLIGTIMGERLIYLPSAGFCLALAAGLAHLTRTDGRPGRVPTAFVAAVGIVVALYGARTVARNAVWREPLGFFSAMIVDAPRSARSHRELGTVLADLGRFAEARQSFERSLAIKPEDATTLYNLGNALSREGRYDDAVEAYERALARNPAFVEALENLGNAESMRGDQQAALSAFQRALALTPDEPILQMNVANTHFRAGALAEARAGYERALALAPGSVEIRTNYGSFLYAQSDFAAAVDVLGRIPPPAPARALVALGASQQVLGRTADARATLATAERLYPGDGNVRQLADFLRRGAAAGAAP